MQKNKRKLIKATYDMIEEKKTTKRHALLKNIISIYNVESFLKKVNFFE